MSSTNNLLKHTSLIVQSEHLELLSIYLLIYRHRHRQLTKLPAGSGRKFSRACVDSPSEADTYSIKLRDGDIVVAYVRLQSSSCAKRPLTKLSICRPMVFQTMSSLQKCWQSARWSPVRADRKSSRFNWWQTAWWSTRGYAWWTLGKSVLLRVSLVIVCVHASRHWCMFCNCILIGEAAREGMFFRGGVSNLWRACVNAGRDSPTLVSFLF